MEDKEFLDSLYKIGALKFGSFVLASGNSSKFYIDLRLIPSYPDLFERIGQQLVNRTLDINFDMIVGIPTAGVPFASYIAIKRKTPLIYLRKETKNHGLKKKLEGISVNNKKVLLVDDLISSGFSKEFAITNIREAGGVVNNILVIVDRIDNVDDKSFWEDKNRVEVISLFRFSSKKIHNFGNENDIFK